MREIVFRARTIRRNEWVYGALTIFKHGDEEHAYIREFGLLGNPIEVRPETVGQKTHRVDKNGTPIWEGDIIRHNRFLPTGGKALFVVEYECEGDTFVARRAVDGYAPSIWAFASKEIEIVGDITNDKIVWDDKYNQSLILIENGNE